MSIMIICNSSWPIWNPKIRIIIVWWQSELVHVNTKESVLPMYDQSYHSKEWKVQTCKEYFAHQCITILAYVVFCRAFLPFCVALFTGRQFGYKAKIIVLKALLKSSKFQYGDNTNRDSDDMCQSIVRNSKTILERTVIICFRKA